MTLKHPGRLYAACLLATLCGAVQAQNVTLYGLLDVAIDHINNVDAAGDTLLHMSKLSGAAPSRIGLRGSEDLGGGYTTLFQLESGIQMATGNLNNGNRLFGRAAWVGLETPYGRFTVGRQFNMTIQGALVTDVIGPALYSLASMDSYIPNSMTDNTVAYIGSYRGWSVGASYTPGRDTATTGGPGATNCPGESPSDHTQCTQWTAMLKYETPAYGMVLTHDLQHGGPNAIFGLNNSHYTDARSIAGGFARFGTLKVAGGVLHRERDLALVIQSNLWYIGAAYPLTERVLIDGQVARYDVLHSGDDATMLLARATYAFSKRTRAYAMAGRMNNAGMAANPLSGGSGVGPGKNQTGLLLGMQHTF